MHQFADVQLYWYIYYYPRQEFNSLFFFFQLNMQLKICNIYPNHAAEVPVGQTLY